MKCVNCGHEITGGRSFCGICGTPAGGEIKMNSAGGQKAEKAPENNSDGTNYDKSYGTDYKVSMPRMSEYSFDSMPAGSTGMLKPRPQSSRYVQRQLEIKPKKKSKTPVITAAVLGAVMVISAVVMAVGIFAFGWFDGTSPKKDPAETVNVAVAAINRNDSKSFFNCLKPDLKNKVEGELKTATSAFGTMFGGKSPNSYEVVDKTFEYFKFILGVDEIELKNTEISQGDVNNHVDMTADLYLGTMNMGKIKLSLDMVDGIWYISAIDTKGINMDTIHSQIPPWESLFSGK